MGAKYTNIPIAGRRWTIEIHDPEISIVDILDDRDVISTLVNRHVDRMSRSKVDLSFEGGPNTPKFDIYLADNGVNEPALVPLALKPEALTGWRYMGEGIPVEVLAAFAERGWLLTEHENEDHDWHIMNVVNDWRAGEGKLPVYLTMTKVSASEGTCTSFDVLPGTWVPVHGNHGLVSAVTALDMLRAQGGDAM